MSATVVIRTSIDKATKAEATAVLAELGMSASDAVRHLMTRVARDKALPFDPPHPMDDFEPGPVTRAAMTDGDTESYETIDELFAALNAPD